MIEIKPLPTYAGIWLRNGSILNFHKITDINKESLNRKFLAEFGRMSSFFPVYSFTNNLEVRINKGDTSIFFKNQSISKEYISKLKSKAFYMKIDVVEHPTGFAPFVLLEDKHNQGFFFEKRIFSYRIQDLNVQRINNNDKWFCSETVYARDLYDEYIKTKNSKITKEEYFDYLKLFNHIMTYILKNDHICDFKSPHLGSDTHIFYMDNEGDKRDSNIKYWENRMTQVLPLRYSADNPLFEHNFVFFAIPKADVEKKGFNVNTYNGDIRVYKYPEMAMKKVLAGNIYAAQHPIGSLIAKDCKIKYVKNIQQICVKHNTKERLPHKIYLNE